MNKNAMPRRYSGVAAVIGWCSAAASVIGSGLGLVLGGELMFSVLLFSTAIGGLLTFVAGIVTVCGRRRAQGGALVVVGALLLGLFAMIVAFVGAAFSGIRFTD